MSLTIDYESRRVAESGIVLGCVGDADVKRLEFTAPAEYCGTDLSDFTVTIHYRNAGGILDEYVVDDMAVSEGAMTFSWLVGRTACEVEGVVEFNVKLRLMDDDIVAKEVNSGTWQGKVLPAMNNAEAAVTPYSDAVTVLIEGWQDTIDSAVSAASSATSAASSAAAQAVDAKAQALAAAGTANTAAQNAQDAADNANHAAVSIGALSKKSSGDSVECSPAADATLLGAEAKGWAEQTQTVGKNLAKPPIAETQRGITLSYDADGYVVLNGTATQNVFFSTYITFPAGTYAISANNPVASQSYGAVSIRIGDSNALELNEVNKRASFTYDVDQAYWTIRIASGAVLSNFKLKPQIEAGDTATSWEPYSGGAPSPSPDYPQEIRVARGRNLLNPADFITVSGGPDTIIDGVISDSTPIGDSRSFDFSNSNWKITVKPGTYTLSLIKVLVGSNANAKIVALTQDNTRLIDVELSAAASFATFTVTDETTIGILAKTYDYKIRLQLELGSTPTPYVPYGHVGLEVRPQITLYKSNYYINTQGVETALAGLVIRKASPTGSSMTATCVTNSNGSIHYHGYDADGNWVMLLKEIAATYAGTWVTSFDVPDNVAEIRMSAYVSFMFNLATTTPIPLPSKGFAGALPDGTADALAVDSAGRWEWVCPTDEKVLVGGSDENWSRQNTGTANWYHQLSGMPTIGNVNVFPFATHYQGANVSNSNTEQGIMHVGSSGTLRIRYGDETSTSDFKTWLASNPVTVLYPLATPTTEHGYIDLPTLTDGCTVSCKELDDLGIEWLTPAGQPVADSMKALRAWAESEQESRIAALEDAVASLATQ